jgi:hypothetical protein
MEYWLSGAELTCEDHPRLEDDVNALRAALAQPDESFCDTHCTWHNHHPDCALAQPEPVAWIRQRDNTLALSDGGVFGGDWTPLYAHPPQRKPLTDEALMALLPGAVRLPPGWKDFARAIEAAHGIGSEA